MPKRHTWFHLPPVKPGDRRRQTSLSGLLLAVMGGVFTSRLVLAFFDMDSAFNSCLSLSAQGLSSLFLYQTLTHLLIPGSIVVFALCALLFFLAGRALESVLGRQNFAVLLLGLSLIHI
jgi:hypothetical protein